jgi:hypothetical protein
VIWSPALSEKKLKIVPRFLAVPPLPVMQNLLYEKFANDFPYVICYLLFYIKSTFTIGVVSTLFRYF